MTVYHEQDIPRQDRRVLQIDVRDDFARPSLLGHPVEEWLLKCTEASEAVFVEVRPGVAHPPCTELRPARVRAAAPELVVRLPRVCRCENHGLRRASRVVLPHDERQ